MDDDAADCCADVDVCNRGQHPIRDGNPCEPTPWDDPSPWLDRICFGRWRIWLDGLDCAYHDPVSNDFSYAHHDTQIIKFVQLII